jgi:hypothetical protein
VVLILDALPQDLLKVSIRIEHVVIAGGAPMKKASACVDCGVNERVVGAAVFGLNVV